MMNQVQACNTLGKDIENMSIYERRLISPKIFDVKYNVYVFAKQQSSNNFRVSEY